MKSENIKRAVFCLGAFLAFILLWEVSVGVFGMFKHTLPAPSGIAKYLFSSVADLTLPKAIWVTMQRLLLGYAIGLAAGIPVGMLCARFNAFNDTIGMMALGLQALPSVCWVPLAIMWFGQTEQAMLFVVVMGTVWSMILATIHGVKNIPPIYLRAASTMGSKGLHTWLHVILPASLPSILGGMKQGWAFAWRSLMAAEIYVTILTGFGLGQLLHYGRELLDMNQVMGVMFTVIAIGLLVDKLLFSPLENSLRKKWGISKN